MRRKTSLHDQRVGVFRLLYRSDFYPEEALKEQEELFLSLSGTYFDEEALTVSEEAGTDGMPAGTAFGWDDPEGGFGPEDGEHILRKFEAVHARIPELDEKIDSVSKNWRTGRMGRVELAILRLALYEILYDEDVPAGVAINEAVELTKEFGDDQSPGFVNAVLGRFAG